MYRRLQTICGQARTRHAPATRAIDQTRMDRGVRNRRRALSVGGGPQMAVKWPSVPSTSPPKIPQTLTANHVLGGRASLTRTVAVDTERVGTLWEASTGVLENKLAVSELNRASGRSARKAKGEGHVRRAEILEAAERLFVECGYEGATIRKIADEVGVSSTALYMHFKDKSEILSQICEDGFGKLAKVTDEIEAETQSPETALRRKMWAYARFGFDNPNAYRLIHMTRPGEAGSAQAAAQRVGRSLYERLRTTVQEMDAEQPLTRDPHTATQMIWAGVHGLVSLMLTKPYFDWSDRDQLVDGMMDALISDLKRA